MKFTIACLLSLFSFASVGSEIIPSRDLKDGGFYSALDAIELRADTPLITGNRHNNVNDNLLKFNDRVSTSGGRITIGYSFGAKLPSWAGSNFRVQASSESLSGKTTKSESFFPAASGSAKIGDGTLFLGGGAQNFNSKTIIDTKSDQWRLAFSTDYAISSSFTITPTFAVVGRSGELTSQIREFAVTDATLTTVDSVLKTSGKGAKIGLAGTYHFNDSLDFHAGVELGSIRKTVSMTAADCGSNGTATSVDTVCNGAGWRTSRVDSASATSTQTTVSMGLTYRPTRAWVLFGSLAADRESMVAGYRTPRPGDAAPMSIRFTSTQGYQANIGAGFFF